MMKLKIKDRELQIKFGYKATLKSRLISRVARKSQDDENEENNLLKVEDMLLLIPEIVLVGLQKFHKDEFGYDIETNEGKQEALDKVFDLMDDMLDNEEANIVELYNKLQDEMMKESFLKSVFQREVATLEQ